MGALLQGYLPYPIKTLFPDKFRDYQIHRGNYDFQETGLDGTEGSELDLTKYEMETIYNYNAKRARERFGFANGGDNSEQE